MTHSDQPSAVLAGQPFQFALFWWGAASLAMQTFWVAHKAASTCIDRLGRAALSVGASALWPVSPSSPGFSLASVPASPATPPLIPDPEQPISPHPTPDPIPPEINDPPPVEVPQPLHEPPVMPPPVAEETHEVFGDGETESSPETAPGASAPLSKPALATAPRDEEGPLISEADPTSNAG